MRNYEAALKLAMEALEEHTCEMQWRNFTTPHEYCALCEAQEKIRDITGDSPTAIQKDQESMATDRLRGNND